LQRKAQFLSYSTFLYLHATNLEQADFGRQHRTRLRIPSSNKVDAPLRESVTIGIYRRGPPGGGHEVLTIDLGNWCWRLRHWKSRGGPKLSVVRDLWHRLRRYELRVRDISTMSEHSKWHRRLLRTEHSIPTCSARAVSVFEAVKTPALLIVFH
jgi:hypothetical protein